MSHDRGWRAACLVTSWIQRFHFEDREVARGVTAMVVGSGAWLGVARDTDTEPSKNRALRSATSDSLLFRGIERRIEI